VEHPGRQVDAGRASGDGDSGGLAGALPGAAPDIENVVGGGDLSRVDEKWVVVSTGGVVAVGVDGPLVAVRTIPGGGLLEVGHVDGAVLPC
jgi:hypothetical protein